MKAKKIEEKIIQSIDTNDVPSLEKIKSRMDFSKNPFKEKEAKTNPYQRKLVFGCVVSALCTLILCLACMFVIINDSLGSSTNIEDVLSKEEKNYLFNLYEEVDSEPIFYSKPVGNYEIYVYECYSKKEHTKEYYYKFDLKGQNINAQIYVGNELKVITKVENFGLLLSLDYNLNNQKIEFEIEIDGVKRYYCFTN